MDGYLTEFKVSKNSPLVNRTLLDRKINENYEVIVLDVLRNGEIINSNLRNLVILEDDILFVKGSFDNFQRLKEIEKLVMLADENLTQDELEQEDNILAECLVTDNSELIGLSFRKLTLEDLWKFCVSNSKRRRNYSKKTCPFYFKAF